MMQKRSAGEPRRGRRRALNWAGLITVAVAVLLTIGRGNAERESGSRPIENSEFTRSDAEIATHLLESVRAANPVICAAVDRTFDSGYWGRSQYLLDSDNAGGSDASETAMWIGKRKLDRAVLEVARPGLASDDLCTRRISIRILGNAAIDRLHEVLSAELAASSPIVTRVSAIRVLGYAEQTSSIERLRELVQERDRQIRLAAIWALGRLEDPASNPLMVNMLKSDADPEIRRAAAWALGRIND